MARFKMPDDAEAGFRLCVTPSFAAPFVMRAWGAGKWGWFTATCRNSPPLADLIIPQQRFRKSQWRSLLNHAEHARLWELPESLPPPAGLVIEDGSSVLLEVQDSARYHRVARHEVLEPGLARTVNFLLQASTGFDVVLAGVAAHYFQQVEPLPRLQGPAEEGAPANRPRD
jgi:hypothetical protein